MTRGQLMEALYSHGVDKPERLTGDLSDEAIEGTIRWYELELQQGKDVTKTLLAFRLREGGMAGFGSRLVGLQGGKVEAGEKPWYQTSRGRIRWIDQHVPDLEPDWAEVAVIGLISTKRQPTAELVRKWAARAEKDQADYDAEMPKMGQRRTEAKQPPPMNPQDNKQLRDEPKMKLKRVGTVVRDAT